MAQCILGYVGHKGSTWCSLQIGEMKAAVAGVFELGPSCHTDGELIRLQMQPLNWDGANRCPNRRTLSGNSATQVFHCNFLPAASQ